MQKIKYHILVVDDDDRIRELVKEYLKENKFVTSTANSAEEAKIKLNYLKYDLIVLDVMMPGQNGFELTKEIKKWAKKYKFDKDPDFMKNLRMVRKRVQNIKTLKLPKQLESELKPMIFKFASYKLLDKRNPNAHFGSSTRVQMTNATLWNSMGDPGGESACNTTYRPNYTFMDEQRPRTPFGTASREQMTKAQLWAAMGLTGEASTEATYDKNYSLTDERQPAFSFGVSARPSPVLKTGAHEAPIYMVPIEKTPKLNNRNFFSIDADFFCLIN